MGKKIYIYGGNNPSSPIEQYDVQHTHFAPIDIYETENNFFIDVELPGVSVADISVFLEENLLVIEGEKRKESPCDQNQQRYLCMERTFGMIRRTLKIESDIDESAGFDATCSGGVLRVKLAKRLKKSRRKLFIPIKGGGE